MVISGDSRQEAKKGIVDSSETDSELEDTLSAAENLKLKLQKEQNRHTEELSKHEKGYLGIFFGNQSNVASLAALFVVIACLVAFFIMVFYKNTDHAEKTLAVGVSALTFLFGKSASK